MSHTGCCYGNTETRNHHTKCMQAHHNHSHTHTASFHDQDCMLHHLRAWTHQYSNTTLVLPHRRKCLLHLCFPTGAIACCNPGKLHVATPQNSKQLPQSTMDTQTSFASSPHLVSDPPLTYMLEFGSLVFSVSCAYASRGRCVHNNAKHGQDQP